jgi:Fe-S cluster assembly protein SufD
MAIHSFLKAEKGDPDWQFSPEDYFGKEFKIIDANVIELEDGEKEHVVLRQNPTEKELLAKRLNVVLQKNSMLDMMIVNEVDDDLQQVFLYDCHLKSNSVLSLGVFLKDGKLNKHIFQMFLEEGAKLTIYGLITNSVKGDTEVITKVVHNGPASYSNQLFLGLAHEESQTVFQSSVLAESSADSSGVSIESSNLIVGDLGKCYSKPETFLNAEYMTCNYASETSSISLEKLGYLQSKGLSEEISKELLVSSFRNQVIGLINQDLIQEEVKKLYSN